MSDVPVTVTMTVSVPRELLATDPAIDPAWPISRQVGVFVSHAMPVEQGVSVRGIVSGRRAISDDAAVRGLIEHVLARHVQPDGYWQGTSRMQLGRELLDLVHELLAGGSL